MRDSRVLKYAEGKFVDPEHVNSTVRIAFSTDLDDDGNVCFDGAVTFGDCSRTISWDGYSGGANAEDAIAVLVKKIDGAIEVLRRGRAELLVHAIEIANHKKKHPKKKKKGRRL